MDKFGISNTDFLESAPLTLTGGELRPSSKSLSDSFSNSPWMTAMLKRKRSANAVARLAWPGLRATITAFE